MAANDEQQQQQHHNCTVVRRNAVFLNNAGVSLLERGYYREAMVTIQDAVSLIKTSIATTTTTTKEEQQQPGLTKSLHHHHGGDGFGTGISSCMIGRASRRLSCTHRGPAPRPTAPTKPTATATTTTNVCVVTVSEDSFVTTDMDSILQLCPMKDSVAFPIRIESSSSSSSHDIPNKENDAQLTSIILLHNFGIASLCRAKETATTIPINGRSNSRMMHRTLDPTRTFRLCQMILASSSSSGESSPSTSCHSISPNPHRQQRVFFLGYLMLSTLVWALSISGKEYEAHTLYQSKLRKLKALICELGKISDKLNNNTAMHASAA